MAREIPEFVYLITMDSEWVVTAVADCHPSTPEAVAKEVERRNNNSSSPLRRVRVLRARLVDIQEMELVPEQTIPASLRELTT